MAWSLPLPSQALVRAATVTAAQLFMMDDQLGRVAPGYLADLLLLDGSPLEDIGVLMQPDERLRVIIKQGQVVKNVL